MAYQVLYRKYRPRDFSDVVGQDHIVSVLRRELETGRVAHAYLFSGPRGIGKTTVARIIAKALNCANASGVGRHPERSEGSPATLAARGVPCNTCPSCEVFNAGSALNLIEIDAASNRGIDEIRELREAVRFSPAGGRYKVYIIDECHQLSRDAANALLKTLEEPPAHAVFILATTELDKVPQTVVSRTQHFDFRRPRREVIAGRLAAIAKAEGVRLDPEAADTIAFAAEGSVRDAESMLGKILAVEDQAITASEVEEILGIPPREAVWRLVSAIAEQRLSEALDLVSRLYRDGFELDYLTKLLIGAFREILFTKLHPVPQPSGGASASPGYDCPKLSAEELAAAITHLIDALAASKRTPLPELPLELALVNIISGKKRESGS